MRWKYSLEELARTVGARPPGSEKTFSQVSTDTRTLEAGDVFFALSGERYDGNRFAGEAFAKGAVAAVTTAPAEGGPCILVSDPLEALQQFARHHRTRYDLPVFALTGSCGKTTAKDFTTAVLQTRYNVTKTMGNLNNDVGCPLSLLRIDDRTDMAVIEMGANHVGDIRRLCGLAQPTESAITMIGPAHLEGFGSIERVAQAKGEIVEALGGGGRFYVNADDPRCVQLAEGFQGERVYFGRSGDVILKHWEYSAAGMLALRVDPVGSLELPLPVPAHVGNVLLAIAVGLRHGITAFQEPLAEACRHGARFHVEYVGDLEVLDDSYNANPASVAAALEALAARPGNGRRIAVLGEMMELGDTAPAFHRKVGEQAAKHGISSLFARGPHARDMIAAALGAGVPHAEAIESHEALAAAVLAAARPGDSILIKGSRSMYMEKVLAALREQYPAGV